MKVILQQEAEYELNVEKNASIPLPTFLKMVGVEKNDNKIQYEYPALRLFKSIDEFKKEYTANGSAYSDADVQILNNGQICVFRNPFPFQLDNRAVSDDNSTATADDGTTSTEENKAE